MTTAAQKKAAAAKRKAEEAKKSREIFDYIEAKFGLTDAVLAMDKTDAKTGFTLKEAFEEIRKGKITDPNRAANILARTNWFKTYGVEVTNRLAQEKSAPQVFSRSVDAKYSALRDKAAASGLQVSDADLRAMAREQYVYGFDDGQVVDKLLESKQGSYNGGGSTYEALSALDQFAYQHGVKVNDQDKAIWANQILAGDKTPADYEQLLREKSAQTYTVFADQIRGGQSLSDLTSAYRDTMANLLEIDPSMVSWDDPLFKGGRAFTAMDANGQPALKSLWDFEKEVKSDGRWQHTKNALETYTNAGASLLKRFGMVA